MKSENFGQMIKTKKEIKQVMGYCIICGEDTPQNISMPFCECCFLPYKNEKLTFIVKGNYCHECGNPDKSISRNYALCRKCTPFDRDDNSVDDYYLLKVNEYRNMSSIERQEIKPFWSCETPNIYMQKGVLKKLEITEVLKMVESTGAFNTNDVFENEPKSNRRIMNFLKEWKNGVCVYPPNIKYGDPFEFGDGRHRCLAAKFLGAKTIPVFCINIH